MLTLREMDGIERIAEIRLTDGTTVAEYLASQPASWRSAETSAIFECLRRGWPLHKANIQCMARELTFDKSVDK